MELRNAGDRPPNQSADPADGDASQLAGPDSQSAPDRSVQVPEAPIGPPEQPDRQKLLDRLNDAQNRSEVRDQLRGRMDQLKKGHPSSPWHEDGTPRPSELKLTNLEHPDPVLSDADYSAHVAEVEKGLQEYAHLATDNVHTINPDKNIWSDERTAQQDQIVQDLYAAAADVPCERQAIIAGGLGGAGKTTVLEKQAGIDLSQFLTINPDKIKEELAGRGMLPKVPGLTPMETSSLAHEESSYIARRLAMRAYAEGKNVIWDITMSRPSSGDRVNELRNAGYQQVSGVFVDIPIETSIERSNARHRRGYEGFLAGQGLGGRFVPNEVIRAQASPENGSKNRAVFDGIRAKLDDWTIYDNSVEGRAAAVVDRS